MKREDTLEKAKELLLSAKKNNADAVKIQTYSADTMTIKSDKEEFLALKADNALLKAQIAQINKLLLGAADIASR